MRVKITMEVEVHSAIALKAAAKKIAKASGKTTPYTLCESVYEVLVANGPAPLDCGVEIVTAQTEIVPYHSLPPDLK